MRPRSGGFSLVEVLIATAIFMAGVAALAQVCARSMSTGAESGAATVASLAAADKLEQLRALAFGVDSGGAAVTDTGTDTTIAPEPSGGPGLSRSPPGALAANTAGYCDFLDASGRQLAHAVPDTAPPGSRYVRRWSIEPLPSAPDEAIMVEVIVMEMIVASGAEAARVVSVWTRRSR